jgi:diguanylate cyclase (GGDEF)-like protein/PAS domain S-box-containing protein
LPFQNLESLKGRLDWLQAIVQFVPIGVFQIDGDDKYIFVNPAWEKITGCSLTQALGANWWNVIHPDDQNTVFNHWAQAESDGKELSVECRIITVDKQVRWIRLQTNFLFDDSGKSIIGSMEDITSNKSEEEQRENLIAELYEIKKQLEVASRTDPLTNLLNRRGMEEKLDTEKDRMERSDKPFSLMLCDIDFFKKVNDNYGHDAGDYILTQVSKNIEKHSRKQDLVCRWGGEEFLLMLPETDLNGAVALAEKLRKHVEEDVQVFKSQKIYITLSLGVACMEKGQEVNDCIKKSDLRLYAAKEGGRNKVVSSDK